MPPSGLRVNPPDTIRRCAPCQGSSESIMLGWASVRGRAPVGVGEHLRRALGDLDVLVLGERPHPRRVAIDRLVGPQPGVEAVRIAASRTGRGRATAGCGSRSGGDLGHAMTPSSRSCRMSSSARPELAGRAPRRCARRAMGAAVSGPSLDPRHLDRVAGDDHRLVDAVDAVELDDHVARRRGADRRSPARR